MLNDFDLPRVACALGHAFSCALGPIDRSEAWTDADRSASQGR